jgi:multicomponent Na+:H+ antiporter subunit E
MPEQGTSRGAAPAPTLDSPRRSALLRGVAFFGLWLVLIQSVKAGDIAFGICTAIIATWVSLRLSPPAAGSLRFTSLLLLLPHFLWQSVRAGVDVAGRAFSWPVDVHPGMVTYPLRFPPGQARNTFATITSLLPGTVPCDESDSALVYHCLDTTQPVVAQLCDEERRLAGALVAGRGYG